MIPSPFFWSQLFGTASLVLNIVRFTRHSRRAIMLLGIPTLAAIVFSQYFAHQMQGLALTGASLLSVTLQIFLGDDTPAHHRLRLWSSLVFGFIGVFIVPPTGNWITWIPLLAYLTSRAGEVFHNPIRIRKVWLLSTALWGLYALVYGNWMYLISEITVLSVSLHYLWKAKTQESACP